MKVSGLILAGLAAAQCPVRREFRELSQQEQQSYFDAVRRLHQKPRAYRGGKTMFEYFTRVHLEHQTRIHGTSIFLPWHRQFTYMYEQELRKIDPRVVLPYWDWSLDSAEPHRSRVLQAMGGNGQRNRDYCYPRPICKLESQPPPATLPPP
ncbi:hypothetical protein DSO57_1022883 [Entomophthora muscae]|uniref:Uncharacterized protein n=1 Tax=Entomophthora muscae TaxID=34485 RepID=A0ACC2SFX7_9FUNG|nr:hypothetical protein DSO57_1022883 [Entomophthora muscae]